MNKTYWIIPKNNNFQRLLEYVLQEILFQCFYFKTSCLFNVLLAVSLQLYVKFTSNFRSAFIWDLYGSPFLPLKKKKDNYNFLSHNSDFFLWIALNKLKIQPFFLQFLLFLSHNSEFIFHNSDSILRIVRYKLTILRKKIFSSELRLPPPKKIHLFITDHFYMGGFYACTVCTGNFIKVKVVVLILEQPLLHLHKSVLNAQIDSGLHRRCLNSALAFRHVWFYVLKDAIVPALCFCPVKLLIRNVCPGILYASFPSRTWRSAFSQRDQKWVHFKETKRVKKWVCWGLIVSYVLGENAEIFVSMTAKVGVEQRHTRTLIQYLHKSTLFSLNKWACLFRPTCTEFEERETERDWKLIFYMDKIWKRTGQRERKRARELWFNILVHWATNESSSRYVNKYSASQ